MDSLSEDLEDSALCSLSLFQKRKASNSINQKKSKQAKLDFCITPNNGEQKQSDKNDILDESTSNYFNRKSMCPLCLKVIESESGFITHTKSCAKKHKMTTQELVKVLELQKKHMKERKELGLSSQIVPRSKKRIEKTDKNLDSYDVALGIAISKSLEESKLEKGSATLEEFGFKTNQVSTKVGSRKNKVLQKSILKERTMEERQRIITEKVAVVLLDESGENDMDRTSKMEFKTQLGDIVNVVSYLWNLGQVEGKFDWYVTAIKSLILLDEETVSETVPNTPEKTPSTCLPDDIQDAIAKLNLPSGKLSTDWGKMINSMNFSDLIGKTKDSQSVYLHSLVLQARCPNILEKDYQSILEKFNLSTVLIFLEFVYCGTLNTLIGSEVNNLMILAGEFDYEELIETLNGLETSEDVEAEITIIENNQDSGSYPEDKDLIVEDMVDLTQSSHSTIDEKDESNIEKSYWSFIQEEKKREEELRKEEEKENSLLTIEREKIETNMKQRDEIMQKIMEYEEEADFRDSLELEKICGSQSFSPVDEIKGNASDCIVLSSDSDTRASPPDMESPDLKIPSPPVLDYEVPFFDPYDDLIPCSVLSPVDSHSESLVSGNISRELQQEDKTERTRKTYCSTPLSNCRDSKSLCSNKRLKKRRCDLTASRIIRKSLNLQQRRKSIPGKRKTLNRNPKEPVEVLTTSILHDFSKSMPCQSPEIAKNFLEITPLVGRDEFGESVTPSPNYSKMDDSVLKEHLARYGLKRSLPKSKAKKILRHIYEELHPRLNPETGKIVKVLPSDKPKTKKVKPKGNKLGKKTTKKKSPDLKSGNSSEETIKPLDDSLDRSTDDDSGNEFENLNEPLTQSAPNNPLDLPSAFREYLQSNPEYHRKILEYEPIWLEDLQKRLKETFRKHFKLSDLMDYLDEKCITFRSEAQKRTNQKRLEKKSPRKNSS